MAKMLASGLIRSTKIKEINLILEQFKVTMKKEGEPMKNMELDHLQNMWINFCKLLVKLNMPHMVTKPPTQKLWVQSAPRPGWSNNWVPKSSLSGHQASNQLCVDTNISSHTLEDYFADSMSSSFVLTDPDTLLGSGVFVMGEFWTSLIQEETSRLVVLARSVGDYRSHTKKQQSPSRATRNAAGDSQQALLPLSQKLFDQKGKLL